MSFCMICYSNFLLYSFFTHYYKSFLNIPFPFFLPSFLHSFIFSISISFSILLLFYLFVSNYSFSAFLSFFLYLLFHFYFFSLLFSSSLLSHTSSCLLFESSIPSHLPSFLYFPFPSSSFFLLSFAFFSFIRSLSFFSQPETLLLNL
jgi:hypothetical protein